MKKRKITTVLACFFALMASAQSISTNLDWKEDTADVTTVEDIIAMQQRVTTMNVTEKHYADVWAKRSYFNVAFNMSTLSPKDDVYTGMPGPGNGKKVENMKSNYGLALEYGRNYRLHKKPIANMLQFYIDYTGIDFGFNHFSAEDGEKLYDSSNKWKYTDDDGETSDCYYTPWNLEKYEVSYGMTIGPSLSVAPFLTTGSRDLHYLKLNFYYHIGYHAGVLFFKGDKKADANPQSDKQMKDDYETMKDNTKIDWSIGLTNTFGLNLTWKTIGIGYEHRTANEEYKSLNTSNFGGDKYKFKNGSNRIYLQIRM